MVILLHKKVPAQGHFTESVLDIGIVNGAF